MIYEFECSACAHVQEELLPMSVVSTPQEPPVLCVVCGQPSVRLVTGGSGTIFKGGGWTSKTVSAAKKQQAHADDMTRRQFERYGPEGTSKLVPNVNGEIHDSWDSASRHAKSIGKEDPMWDHMAFREKELKKITVKDSVSMATPASVSGGVSSAASLT